MLMLERKEYQTPTSNCKDIVLNEGSEANIIINKKGKTAYKEWKPNMIPTIPNKVQKLEEMAKIKELDDYMVETSYLIERNGQTKGYVMPYKEDEEPNFYE